MIEKIINILTYLGITLISGYVIWMCNLQNSQIGLTVGLLGVLGSIFGAKKVLSKDPTLSQLFEVLGLCYGFYSIYCGFSMMDQTNIPSIYFRILCFFSFMFVYSFYYYFKIIKTNFTEKLALTGFTLFMLSLVLELTMMSNLNIVLAIISVLTIMMSHFCELPDNNFSHPLFIKTKNIIKEFFIMLQIQNDEKLAIKIAMLMSVGFLILVPFVSGFLSLIAYYSTLSLFLGLLTVLNNKKLSIIVGFWLSLFNVFYLLFKQINVDTSVWVLIGGVSCLTLALTLKKIKAYIESTRKVSDYAPKFILKLKLENETEDSQ